MEVCEHTKPNDRGLCMNCGEQLLSKIEDKPTEDADGYYGEDEVGEEDMDLSFLDDSELSDS